MQVPVHATQRGKLETPIPSILCKAAEFKPPRFSQAGTAAQAVLGGRRAEPAATHGPRALDLGRRRASGTESLWLH